ncbi:hypothetical protein [Hominibacterium faecale]|uniref:hypothetical protein n=1 Tax=Hominibacterium faecale TaxID=2839743 RepID=UPI0022B2A779|nr:hypothetical protein [Hominibacterium faecale]
MYKLEFYYVPTSCIFQSEKQKELCRLNLEHWVQINIGDAQERFSGKSLWEIKTSFTFVDYSEEVAKLLWDLKEGDEDLIFRVKPYRYKRIYENEKMKTLYTLNDKIKDAAMHKVKNVFLYLQQKQIVKLVSISEGEIIEVFAREECAASLENAISKWADKTEYYKYELDLHDTAEE